MSTQQSADLEVRSHVNEAQEALDICRGLSFETPAERELASEILGQIKTQAKKLKTREEEITKPIRTGLDSIRALFKPVHSAYAAAEAHIKDGCRAAVKAEEEQAQAAIVAAGGDASALARIAPPSMPVGMSVRRLPRVRIVDIGVVPRRFLVVDEAAVLRAVKEKEIVPGVEIWYEESVAKR